MPGKNHTYHEKRETGYILQLRGRLAELPPYARDYFRAVEQKSSQNKNILCLRSASFSAVSDRKKSGVKG